MEENEDTTEIKKILSAKYAECNRILKKLKIKNNRLKIIYGIIIFSLLAGQSSIAALSSVTIPPLVIPIISGMSAFLTAISSGFKLNENKKKILVKIEEIKKIKSYIEIMDLPLDNEDRKNKLMEIINTLI